MKNDNGYQNDSALVDTIIEIGIAFIIMPLFMGIALTNMAAQSTDGWDSYSVMMWGLLGMIFIAANIIAVMAHAKYQGKL
jgi:hypothetical protein